MVHLGLGDSFFIVVGCLFISCLWFIGIVSGIFGGLDSVALFLVRIVYFRSGLACTAYVQISAIIL